MISFEKPRANARADCGKDVVDVDAADQRAIALGYFRWEF